MILLSLILIAVLPHPSDSQYECMLIVRPHSLSVLCAPGGNVIDEDKRRWVGVCNRNGLECPNP